MKIWSVPASLLGTVALTIGLTAPAEAHGYLVQSFPAKKAHLRTSPHRISLVFSLKADPGYSMLAVERDDGAVIASQIPTKRSRTVSMASPQLPPGRYRVHYRMLAPDGDFMQGKIDFVVEE